MTHKTPIHLLIPCILMFTVAAAYSGPDQETGSELAGKQVGILIGAGFHDGETLEPAAYMRSRGANAVFLSNRTGTLSAYNSDASIDIETTIDDVNPEDFCALVIPGGRGPADIRDDDSVRQFVARFHATGRPIAAICHGPQVLASAGVLDGVSITCVNSISNEMIEYGAEFTDAEVMRDGNIITSRVPGDLPAFNRAIAQALTES